MNRSFRVLAAVLMIWGGSTGCRPLVNRFAFHPDRSDPIPASDLPAGVEEIFIPTEDGERLQSFWLPRPRARWVLIYFHGNAGNIGHRLPELRVLAEAGIHVLGVGYRGYGRSTGSPSESGIYADGRAALREAFERCGLPQERMVLLGRSIGSAVALETARNRLLGGCILVSPMTGGRPLARRHGFGPLSFLAGDAFDNLSKIRDLRSHLLIVHGTADEVVPFEMGAVLHTEAPEPKRLARIEGAGHNDIHLAEPGGYRDAVLGFLADRIR